jgi:glyoxylase-like metal-dependent hydrolase (beta-lactamase superfamily II)
MKPIGTREVLPNILAISNKQVNFYLVRLPNRNYIAFDAGASMELSLSELGKLGIQTEDITAVFLTHTDSDHVGSVGLFKQAKVFISKQEEQMIDGSTKRAAFLGYCKLDCLYETLVDGESVNMDGATVKCLLTPGHTKGSACFIVDDRYLFSGDSFSLKNGKVKPFIAFFNMDGKEQRKSIRKIAGHNGIDAVFTGHHGYTEDFSGAFADWQV